MSDCARLELQLETLFTSDARGRLLSLRAPDVGRAPRFFVGRTRHGNLWRFRADLEPDVLRDLSRLAAREPPLAALDGAVPVPPEREPALRAALTRAGESIECWRGPAYAFRDAGPSAAEYVRLAQDVVALERDAGGALEASLAAHFPDAARALAAGLPCYAILGAEGPLAVCFSARHAPGLAHEAGVETRPEARGRGFAVRVVAAWALAIHAQGESPLYSTRWENGAARRVAAKLDLAMYAEDLHYV